MSKLNIKAIQTCDEEKLLPSLMAIGTKYAAGGTETKTSGQKEHDHRDQDQPENPSSEPAGR